MCYRNNRKHNCKELEVLRSNRGLQRKGTASVQQLAVDRPDRTRPAELSRPAATQPRRAGRLPWLAGKTADV